VNGWDVARDLRRNLVPAWSIEGPFQWATVVATHTSSQSTTLAAAVTAGALTITTEADLDVNAVVAVGGFYPAMFVTKSSGTAAPYTLTLAQPIPEDAASGAAVDVLNTIDVEMDGAPYLTPGIRYLSWYSPAVNDVVAVGRMQGASRTARFVLGTLA
jgi:hypothetical protein